MGRGTPRDVSHVVTFGESQNTPEGLDKFHRLGRKVA